ncbi:two-component regulator propeller domain-containing protein [Pedobacter sp. SYSU D00535]|uniref:two-component regulator propeller domain-containing protein n=1 Tax=Pedobacter sp. SYSU D00535 TaxID=2810308 RepID=UPI001A97CAB4|nr:two-component regulator propeller domain-containing protein [Pedobacter sp. SYSU D00535]
MKHLLFFSLFLSGLFSVHAVENPPLDYLGIEHGLSNNAVTSIYQDRNGFMWFGTYEGLNRYDGYSFKVFRNRLNDSTSLIHNWVVALAEDDRNNIWIGTKQGASVYDPITARFSFLYYKPTNSTGLERFINAVNDFEVDLHGNVFIATGGKGLLIKGTKIKHARQIPFKGKTGTSADYHVQGITIDEQQRVWLFIQGEGLARYDYKTQKICLINNSVTAAKCLQADQKGGIWIGTEEGLRCYNFKSKALKSYRERDGAISNDNIHGLSLIKKEAIWVATDGGGINIIRPGADKIERLLPGKEKGSLTSGAVNAVFEDKDKRIWIGTLRGGINILDERKTRFKTISHNPFNHKSLINNFILSFCEDENGNIWIGTDGEGLSFWNRKSNSYTNYRHRFNDNSSLSNNNVAGIVKDYKNDIWVATYGGGVNKFNKRTNQFETFPLFNYAFKYNDRNAWSLYQDRSKTLWVGTCTNGGLYYFNRSLNKFQLFDPNLRDAISITEDRQGNFWLGTFTQLIKVDRKQKKHKVYDINFAVRSIYEDRYNNFWIGTEGGGLLNFNRKTGQFKTYTVDDGLPANSILNIIEDKAGELWLSTFNGLSRFNVKTRKFKNFFESDGLQSNQFNYNAALRLSSGEFLFGGIKGFNIFFPEQIKSYNCAPNLLITGLRINNLPYESDDSFKDKQSLYALKELTLPYDKAVISVDFASLDYSSSDKIVYKYYLEGWDNDWIYAGRSRVANYSRLREGKYLLRIKATNAEGVWMPNEKLLQLTILPPWWRSWWAYSFYACFVIGVLYAYNNYQKRQQKLKYQVQLAHLKVEQEKELNEKKLSFFTHISHEFRTPLTLIISPVKEFLNSRDSQVDPKELIVVYRNARRLLSLVDQLLHFRKSDTEELKITRFNMVTFCKEVYLCFQQQAKSKNIDFQFLCEDAEVTIYADKEKMEIVLFNLLSNAFKYTPEGGMIRLAIEAFSSHVRIKVTDTGSGISEEEGTRLFDKFYQAGCKDAANKAGFGIGLYLVKSYVESHKGNVSYSSKVGEGTEFKVELLTGKEHFDSHIVYEHVGETPVFLEELVEELLEEPKPKEEQLAVPESAIVSDKPTMLIVDDNAEIRNYVKRIFQQSYLIYESESAEAGLDIINKYVPDIIITDVVMGEMSGVDLCMKVKEDPALSHIPVILLTSSSSAEIKLKGIEGGADDYITKPFDKDILIARVSNLLKSRNNLQRYFYNQITFKSDNSKVSPEYKEFLEKCISITEKHLDNDDFNVKILADEVGMSHSALYKKVKSISGKSVNEFIRFIRLRKAAELFINTDCNVNEGAFQAGFNDIKYFREQFSKLYGMKPSEFIKAFRQPFNKTYKLNKNISKM